ncbi:MAG: type II toxin-antitoxin system HicA family toxin [Sedimentisphaerales bacterium]|nr:type II toxin-antitoxin system HicA family toxin [Sedimentisphaerales bacterium]
MLIKDLLYKAHENYYFFLEQMYSLSYTLIVTTEARFSKVKKLLEEKGYNLTRISGSHHIFTKKGLLPISIPVHSGKVKGFYVKQIEKIE